MNPGLSVDHIALPCFEPAETRRFYSEVLGLPLSFASSGPAEGSESAWLLMGFALANGAQLAFFSVERMKRPEDGLPDWVRHVALAVSSAAERERWKKRLIDRGVNCWEEDHGSQQSLYFKDPNGLVFEITYPASAEVADAREADRIVEDWISAYGRRG